jgi:ABC-2 type transport system permease protein
VALIYHGRMIALDSPARLKEKVADREILEIDCPEPQRHLENVTALPEVREATLYGAGLHVMVADRAKATAAIRRALPHLGPQQLVIAPVAPAMEDVFISLIEAYDRERDAVSDPSSAPPEPPGIAPPPAEPGSRPPRNESHARPQPARRLFPEATRRNARRLFAMALKESRHVLRDWRSLLLAIAYPMLLILLFGYALNMDLDNVPTAVWDRSGTPASRELLGLFRGSPYFDLQEGFDSYRDLQAAIDHGRAMLALVIPADFADRILSGGTADLQVLADGSDANTARLALGYAAALGQIYNGRVGARPMALAGHGAAPRPVKLESRAWYNPDLRSPNVIVPGIVAVVMVVIAAMLTSVTVAREWETGTMEQLIGTPLRVPELLFGKVFPYFLIGIADVTIAVVLGQWLFEVPLRGSTALVFAMAALFLTGALFFGLLLSIVLKKQVLANQLALFGSYLPTLLLSGFVFAIENMPAPIQLLTTIVPARYFIALLRGIYLKGIGLEILWLNALLLTVYAALMVGLAGRRLKLMLE